MSSLEGGLIMTPRPELCWPLSGAAALRLTGGAIKRFGYVWFEMRSEKEEDDAAAIVPVCVYE